MNNSQNNLPTKLKATLSHLAENKKTILIGSLILLVLAGFAFSFWKKQQAEKEKNKNITIETVKRDSLTEIVAANGRVVPNFEVEIKPKASGKIIRLPYDISDKVKEGDLLVQLDPIDETRQVTQAEASLSSLESKLSQARLNSKISQLNLQTEIEKAKANISAAETKAKEAEAKFNRQKKLFDQDFISKEEFEISTTEQAQAASNLQTSKVRLKELKTEELNLKVQQEEVQAAKSNIDSSRIGLLNAQQRLSETKIFSPIAGVVTSRPAQIGLIVSSGINNVSGGTVLMTVADLSEIFTIASVDESDIGKIKLDQKVKVTADSFPGEEFEGKVVQIGTKGLNEANVVTFDVKILMLGIAKEKLKPEMTTNVEIIIEDKDDVLLVPVEAVIKRNDRDFVKLAEGNKKSGGKKPKLKLVKTGITDGERIEIVAGLEEGQKIILQSKQPDKSRWKKEGGGEQKGGFANSSRRYGGSMR
ncbi:MAG: efflux RND transporter periplasmic adaptor subunit [Candidatus Caenarcaniphilales bacterium]|nr:efflux RND transporter periplasmic adaptor subunit [Candidatus Caenarcaniphilales bacterium]